VSPGTVAGEAWGGPPTFPMLRGARKMRVSVKPRPGLSQVLDPLRRGEKRAECSSRSKGGGLIMGKLTGLRRLLKTNFG